MSTAYNVYIDCSVFSTTKPSGIAYATKKIVIALCRADELRDRQITLLITKDIKRLPKELQALKHKQIKRLPFSARSLRLMTRAPVSLPLDSIVGKGVYIFPNFYNLPVPSSKSITFVHDVSFLLFPDTVQAKNLRYLTSNIKRWIQRTDVIATLSESSKQDIEKKLSVPAQKIIIVNVPLGEEFRSKAIASTNIKEKYQIPENYILYLGNIEPRKNVDRLIKAFMSTQAAKTGVNLLLVGADKWKASAVEETIEQARRRGVSIKFPASFVQDADLPAIISKANLLVQPSIHEGFGIAPTQALACGTPVLVSDIPVMHEILGKAAEYMDPLDENDMARKIDSMLALIQTKAHKDQLNQFSKDLISKLNPSSAVTELIKATQPKL